MISRRTIVYDGPGGPFEGVAVVDTGWDGPRPGVMIVPNVLGEKEADRVNADRLAALGYAAFVADTYGQGKRITPDSPNRTVYMDALQADRALLRDRLFASLAAMKALPEVDGSRMAATGYCFGGKSVIDLARAGGEVLGVVSFHGVYDPPDYAYPKPIEAKLLICHGWDDPLATPAATVALADELTAAGADWQIHAYGATGHAFTDLSMKTPARPGVAYAEAADRRSWKAMQDFLAEIFG
jgi:dienelactone hydrolase